MTTATASTPLESATTLRAEMRERTAQAIEAMLKRLAPHLAGLDPDTLATVLCVELVRLVGGVQDEGLRQIAELVVIERAEHSDALVGGDA